MVLKKSSLLTQMTSLITHHSITHFLSLKNPQISPKPVWHLNPILFSTPKTQKLGPTPDIYYQCTRAPTHPSLLHLTQNQTANSSLQLSQENGHERIERIAFFCLELIVQLRSSGGYIKPWKASKWSHISYYNTQIILERN